jgi:hypothetical protein
MTDSDTMRKAHCNKCLRSTNHEVLFRQETSWSEDIAVGDGNYHPISGEDIYSLLKCRGCDEVRFLHEHQFSEEWDEDGPVLNRDYYPPQITRQKPEWVVFGLPIKLGLYEFGELIDEIYRALPIKATRLAAMGIRALVEKMMIDKVGDKGTFEQNIRSFFEAGYVAPVQQDAFKSILVEAGHAAMHRGWEPSLDDVNTLLDIVESLIKATYIDPAKAQQVGQRIPPRSRKGTPSQGA